jgi:hypothetical protein
MICLLYFSLCLGIQELKEKLYDLATKLPDPNNRPNTFIGRSIPKSYISLETSIKQTLKDKTEQKKQPFLDHEEFTIITSSYEQKVPSISTNQTITSNI